MPINSLKVGLFYDGSYFSIVSTYYMHEHKRRARISFTGIHEYVKNKIAQEEGMDVRYVQITERHYFRGRFSAQLTSERDMLLKERIFDDILIKEGIQTHYLPMSKATGEQKEKGVDVNLALECFDIARLKQLDVVCLVAGDSDYIPLVRKLTSLGVRTMILGFSFSYQVENGDTKGTRASQMLLHEATYPVEMEQVIDGIDSLPEAEQAMFENLFVRPRRESPDVEVEALPETVTQAGVDGEVWKEGTIVSLKDGYGFIEPKAKEKDPTVENLFFHHSALNSSASGFNDLFVGMEVTYVEGIGQRGSPAALKLRTYY